PRRSVASAPAGWDPGGWTTKRSGSRSTAGCWKRASTGWAITSRARKGSHEQVDSDDAGRARDSHRAHFRRATGNGLEGDDRIEAAGAVGGLRAPARRRGQRPAGGRKVAVRRARAGGEIRLLRRVQGGEAAGEADVDVRVRRHAGSREHQQPDARGSGRWAD